jgi:anti-sigma B factor antagonist
VTDDEEEVMIQRFAPVIRVVTDPEERLVVTVAGEIDLFSAWLIDATLADAHDDRQVHIDCADVNFMDSTGLSALLRHSQRLRRGGGCLRLLRPSNAVRHVVEVAGLTEILATAGDK